jgi:3-dehydroquinate dehydratase II
VRIVVLNGVNLDMLGRRDPEVYGDFTLSDLETQIYEWAKQLECTARCRQTNDEGQYVEWCHDALDWADGVIVNPGAWTHYSYAIRDAMELFTVPVVEVHLSDIDNREEWRKRTVLDGIPTARILGKGPQGYREALELLVGRKLQ